MPERIRRHGEDIIVINKKGRVKTRPDERNQGLWLQHDPFKKAGVNVRPFFELLVIHDFLMEGDGRLDPLDNVLIER